MKELLRRGWYWVTRLVLSKVQDDHFINLIFWINCQRFNRPFYRLNLRTPQTFTEKLNWLKFSHKFPEAEAMADKFRVRQIIKDQLGEELLIPLLGIYKSPEHIDYDLLPDKFVLKATHGSGWNIICHDKETLQPQIVERKFKRWLSMNPYYLSREWQYKNIVPKILCEEYLSDNLNDYKLFCFHGKVKYIQVDVDRFTSHTRNIYDTNWNLLDWEITYPRHRKSIAKPAKLDYMIRISETLAADFIFVRIDLYHHLNRIYFGEITFFPEGGAGPFDSYNSDLKFGEGLRVP